MSLCGALSVTALSVLPGCAAPPPAKSPSAPSKVAGPGRPNWVCSELMGQFLGLPAAERAGVESGGPALAGRWWLQDCSLELVGRSQLALHLGGPGWYWVDSEEGDIALHQQVPFELRADVVGTIRTEYAGGVAWLWFEPSRDPSVQVIASTDLDLRSTSLWGSVLQHVPLLPLRALTAEKLSASAGSAFRARLSKGVTVTYDVFKGQADMSLGQLGRGEAPRHPFEDGYSWIANDRLVLPPAATQVFGPLEPSPLQLDVIIEQGPGVAYQAVCTRDMAASLADVAAGRPERVPVTARVTSGTMLGHGRHMSDLRVSACPYYLIVSTGGQAKTVAALRLRP
jgi:hypothetical protein